MPNLNTREVLRARVDQLITEPEASITYEDMRAMLYDVADTLALLAEHTQTSAALTAHLTGHEEGGGGGGGVDATARAGIASHEASPHNTDGTARQGLSEHIGFGSIHQHLYLGPYSNLSDDQRANVDIGQYVLHHGRMWFVLQRELARASGPLGSINHGWKAIDGYRGATTTVARLYDAGDHAVSVTDGNLYFCLVTGEYTDAQVRGLTDNWRGVPSASAAGFNASNENLFPFFQAILRQGANVTLTPDDVAFTITVSAIPPTPGEGIEIPAGSHSIWKVFRPGARPAAVICQVDGYFSPQGAYTRLGTGLVPHYVGTTGFTSAVTDAYDFNDFLEDNNIYLGGGGGATLRAIPDTLDNDSRDNLYREGNEVQQVTSQPGEIVTVHFIETAGGSRYFNPDNRVAVFPHGGAVTPDLNDGHQWIAGLAIIAVGNQQRIELIADGDQPAGALRLSFATPGEAAIEHLVVPLVADPNTYHSGLVTNIPDGVDLELSITNNNNARILHDGLHRVGLVNNDKLEEEFTELERRIGVLGFAALTQSEYDALPTEQQENGTVYLVRSDA